MKAPTIKPKGIIYINGDTDNWRDMDDVVKACKGKPVKIFGKTLDLQDCQINGSKLPQPDNEDDENSAPLRISIPGFTLKNGSTRRLPGGIVFRKKGLTFRNLVFLDVGEDAISNIVDDSEDSSVIDCQAFGASDKSYQFNDGRGLTFYGCLAVGGITGVRIQESKTKYKGSRTKKVGKNRFVNVDTAYNINGGIIVDALPSTYEGVRLKWKAGGGAKHIGAD